MKFLKNIFQSIFNIFYFNLKKTGKVHFGYIFGFWISGSIGIYIILNYLSQVIIIINKKLIIKLLKET